MNIWRPLAFAIVALNTAAPVLADQPLIPNGAELTATQVGHAFGAACMAGQPLSLKDKLELWDTAFDFAVLDDSAHDFAFASPDKASMVTADIGALSATCTMTLAAGPYGDGAEVYDSLEAHLMDAWRDTEPNVSAIEGGIRWDWTREDVMHSVEFTEDEGAFLIIHIAER